MMIAKMDDLCERKLASNGASGEPVRLEVSEPYVDQPNEF